MELRQLRSAEEYVEASIEELLRQNKPIAKLTKKTRVEVQQVLALDDTQRAVYEQIRGLQLRERILENMRTNWPIWRQKNRHVDIRINQLQGLEQFVNFLKDDEYEFTFSASDASQKTSDSDDVVNPLIGYYVQPTGAGKTGLFSIETALAGVKTLILVPFDNLMYQTEGDLKNIGGIAEKDIGVLCQGSAKELYLRKVLVSTYAGHLARMKRDPDYRKIVQDECELVFCDEGHMALGVRTQEVISEIDEMAREEMTKVEYDAEKEVIEGNGLFMPSKAVKIGFTATPKLAAKHVRQKFGRCIGRIYQAELVQAGINVPYTIIQTDGTIQEGDQILDKMSEDEEVRILDRENVYAKLLTEYASAIKTYYDLKTKQNGQAEKAMPVYGMAFCTNHRECEKFVKDAAALGLKFEILTGVELAGGEKGREQLKAAEARLLAHEIDGFVTVEKLATGYSPNFMNTILWARVTSSARTVQAIGRGGRRHTYPGSIPKTGCIVIETNWSLSKTAKKGKKLPMRLADALFDQGENPEAICGMANGQPLDVRKPLTAERVVEIIKSKYTPQSWAGLTTTQRQGADFAGTGKGIKSIATLFGVDNPLDNNENHNALGLAIWGEEYGDPNQQLKDRVRTSIRAAYTPEQWAEIDRMGKNKISIEGMGLKAIGTLFGVPGNPWGVHGDFLALGRMIWGDIPALSENRERESMRRSIQEKYTPESWAAITSTERGTLKIDGKGLFSIGNLFGIEGNAKTTYKDFLALGRAVWGDLPILSPVQDDFVTLIKDKYSSQEWSSMTKRQRLAFKVNEKGLNAIATAIGFDGNPIFKYDDFIEMGKMIWGDEWSE